MAIILESGALPAVTASNIIERAYRILGDLGSGEALTSDQASVGLDGLNAMLDSFAIEKLMIYVIKQESFTWPASTASRTIGPAGDFVTRRPDMIEVGTYFEDSNAIAYPVDIVRNREVYDNVYDKTVVSSYPEILYYETTINEGTIYLYPVPDQSLTFKMATWQTLQVFDTLSEELAMPPGYRRMLAYNLAKEIEAEVGLPLPARAERIAYQSKRNIKRHNSRPILSQTESAYVLHQRGRSDIVAGK